MAPLEFDIEKLSAEIEKFILEIEKNNRPSPTARPYIEDLKKIILKHLLGEAS